MLTVLPITYPRIRTEVISNSTLKKGLDLYLEVGEYVCDKLAVVVTKDADPKQRSKVEKND